MRTITLSELSRYSPWPARLSGAEPFEHKKKTPEELFREYNDEKYGRLLEAATIEEAIDRYWNMHGEGAFSRHDELFVGDMREIHILRNKVFLDSLRPLLEKARYVVDLGAGFGQMLYLIQREYPHLTYRAGEYTPNGVALGQRLLPNIEFRRFDFAGNDWSIFDGVENALIITVHAVEMLPDAAPFVEKMRSLARHISAAVHFEPIYESDDTPLWTLRRQYIEANGYCRNILQSIPQPSLDRDFFGLNPLFPESRIEWKP